MKFARLLTKFYFEPWGIRAEKHAAMGKMLHDYLAGKISAEVPRELRGRMAAEVVGPTYDDGTAVVDQMEVQNGVAIIPVKGVLGKHLSFLELWCGGCDYDHIGQMADQVEADPSIHSAIFYIESPGGIVIGLPELSQKLVDLGELLVSRGGGTFAYADVECCSCAQWIAASCNETYFAPSATVACIGCFIAAVDSSREWEQMGWKLELFRSGELKAIGLDGKEFTEKERAFLQGYADRGGKEFRDFILSRRPGVPAEAMQGQPCDGGEALRYGLCDGLVNDLRELVAAAMASGNRLGV